MKQLIVFEKPDIDGIIRLKDKDYNYLAAVRRVKEGQHIKICMEGNIFSTALILKINSEKKYIDIKVLEPEFTDTNIDRPCIILMQWVLKGQHMDLVVRQTSEAGVKAIFPVLGEFSIIKTENTNQTERRTRIIREARQQSGSLTETEIFPAAKLDETLDNVLQYTQDINAVFLMLTEKVEKRFKSIFDHLKEKPKTVIMAVGAEGGISPKEEEFLKNNNFKPVHFNTNVLRAETAAIYSIASVQTLLTEGSKWQLNV